MNLRIKTLAILMAAFSLGAQAQTTIEEIAADIRSVWLHFRLNQTNLHYI